jgi:hypothetical protein
MDIVCPFTDLWVLAADVQTHPCASPVTNDEWSSPFDRYCLQNPRSSAPLKQKFRRRNRDPRISQMPQYLLTFLETSLPHDEYTFIRYSLCEFAVGKQFSFSQFVFTTKQNSWKGTRCRILQDGCRSKSSRRSIRLPMIRPKSKHRWNSEQNWMKGYWMTGKVSSRLALFSEFRAVVGRFWHDDDHPDDDICPCLTTLS